MTVRQRISGIWLISMTLLALFAYTVYFVAQMWLSVLQALYLTLAVMQIAALILYLWGPEKLKSRLLKIVYRLLYLSSFLVIPCFSFIFMGLISQYHVRIPDSIDASAMPAAEILPGDETVIYNTGTVYVIFPEYSGIELACGNRPSRSDENITWCSGAAFQHDIRLGFTHENIDGDHAVSGTFYESPYNKDSFSAFTFAKGRFAFEFDNPSEAIRNAAKAGGSGFMQFGLIRDGERVMSINRPRARCYRTLAELNGNLCIIDSVNMLRFEEFMEELHRLGVTNALYMDMGAGWNYSWYRNAVGRVVTLFGLPVPWSHNWVVFTKQAGAGN
ncbi:MAG: hypothetical protein K5922_09465 [Clostridiales bacterium]|nr:hypothetical protein [Clostridiales bacterium]